MKLGNREILPWKGVGLKMESVAKLSPKFHNTALLSCVFDGQPGTSVISGFKSKVRAVDVWE